MHSTEEIIQEAATLPIEQRILIVDSILRTLNRPTPDMDAKWAKVAMQRLDELRSGRIAPVSGEQVFAQ